MGCRNHSLDSIIQSYMIREWASSVVLAFTVYQYSWLYHKTVLYIIELNGTKLHTSVRLVYQFSVSSLLLPGMEQSCREYRFFYILVSSSYLPKLDYQCVQWIWKKRHLLQPELSATGLIFFIYHWTREVQIQVQKHSQGLMLLVLPQLAVL